MKRPEGFDARPAARPPVAERTPVAERIPVAERTPVAERAQRVEAQPKPPRPPSAGARRRRERADLRRAAKARRRVEREEMRRFTRRSRNRRIGLLVAGGLLASLVGLVLVAVFSPLLALRVIRVEGASTVDAAALTAELEAQLGTPLALIDYGRIDDTLQGFPLIRSYSMETVPPDTIIVHIVEREPIVVVERDGGYALVDPAGVVLGATAERPPGVPLAMERGEAIPNPAFDAAVQVLLALPADLRAQVDTVSATTRDDVTLTLVDADQTVRWGSADDSAEKAALLAALRGIHGLTPGTFDVSAPGNGIFRAA